MRWQRMSASPSTAQALLEANVQIDVRHILPPGPGSHSRHPPHRRACRACRQRPLLGGAHTGRTPTRAAGRTITCPGSAMLTACSTRSKQFVTGSRHHVDEDRVLATVLFTDIVDSTRRAAGASCLTMPSKSAVGRSPRSPGKDDRYGMLALFAGRVRSSWSALSANSSRCASGSASWPAGSRCIGAPAWWDWQSPVDFSRRFATW